MVKTKTAKQIVAVLFMSLYVFIISFISYQMFFDTDNPFSTYFPKHNHSLLLYFVGYFLLGCINSIFILCFIPILKSVNVFIEENVSAALSCLLDNIPLVLPMLFARLLLFVITLILSIFSVAPNFELLIVPNIFYLGISILYLFIVNFQISQGIPLNSLYKAFSLKNNFIVFKNKLISLKG